MSATDALAAIQRQIMWNRLIAVVEEQAQTFPKKAEIITVPNYIHLYKYIIWDGYII